MSAYWCIELVFLLIFKRLHLLICDYTENTFSSQQHVCRKRKHPNPMFLASLAYYWSYRAPPTVSSFGQYTRSKRKCLDSSFRGSRYILLSRQTHCKAVCQGIRYILCYRLTKLPKASTSKTLFYSETHSIKYKKKASLLWNSVYESN
jgi:hypothetical protein